MPLPALVDVGKTCALSVQYVRAIVVLTTIEVRRKPKYVVGSHELLGIKMLRNGSELLCAHGKVRL